MTREDRHTVGYAVNLALAFVEFWTFVILRETHVIGWSWWWLVAFQVGSYISVYLEGKNAGLLD